MRNLEIAKIFYEIADILETQDVKFKPWAYEKAARTLESLNQDIEEVYKKGELNKLPGIGKSIAQKIEEIIKTGHLKYYEKLKKKIPINIEEMVAIEGVGPKMVKTLYQKLKIRNIKDLEKAAKVGKIAKLEGFGQKTEKNILKGIEFIKKSKGRFLLGLILPQVREIENKLRSLEEVNQISVAGSVRRMKETIGDVDFLITSSNPQKVMDFFVSLDGIIKIWGKGPTKSSIRLKDGFDVDLRVVKEDCFGSALQYFTGSKEHNIVTRKITQHLGLKLNEYGVFRGKKRIAGKTEKEVYKTIGLPYIEPELRTNRGEIEAAQKNKLPKIIGYKDLKGDLHIHTKWSDGTGAIKEMAKAAKEMGYQYIAITDHTGSLKMTRGLNEKRLLSQMKEIDKINKTLRGFRILKGTEVNILPNGKLDIKDEILEKLDIVLAAVHSHFKMTKKEMTKRIMIAMGNKNVDVIAHPTGRIIQRREPYKIDLDRIIKKAYKTNTALEVNSYIDRLDLCDVDIRKAIQNKVKLIINTDSHNIRQLHLIELGIAQARRGWAEKKDVLNTRSVDKLLKELQK